MSLRVEKINYTYGTGTACEVQALREVSFGLRDGEMAGIIGHTGSGKSTLIQILDGLLPADSGHIYYQGKEVGGQGIPMHELRKKIGLVFQYPESQLFEETVLKDAAFGPANQGLSAETAAQKAKEALQKVKLPEPCWGMSPFELSGGQKRRAAIAGVLAMEPELLILDEPTAGLDPHGRRELFTLIRELHENSQMTVLLVSHSMEDVADYVDRILVMDHGSIQFDGSAAEVFSHVEELEAMGLAVPQVTYLMRDLQRAGYPVRGDAVTVEEAKREILKLC